MPPEPATTTPPTPAGAPPLVTLFVMAYRQERFVRAAVEGAFAQTYSPLEIILSDDNSPDGTFAVMEEMAAAYDGPHRVRLNRNPVNLGITGHVSRLAELASGGLIVHAAGDDISEPDRVARLAAPWIATGGRVKAIHSTTLGIDAEGRPLGEISPPRQILGDVSPLQIVRTSGNCIGATLAFDRRLVERFGPIPGDCAVEDAVLFFRAAISGGIAYVDAPLVRYRVGGLSQATRQSPAQREFHGDRIKHYTWILPNCRSFLADMERVDFPRREACRAEARRQLRDYGFRVRLARGGTGARLAATPRALRLALATRSLEPLKLIAKYLMGERYLRSYDARQPWWRFVPAFGVADDLDPEQRALQQKFHRSGLAACAAALASAETEAGHAPDTHVYCGRSLDGAPAPAR